MTNSKIKQTKKNEWISFKKSKIHSTGGFAVKDIPKGTRIIEYIGKKITKKQADEIADKELAKHQENKNNGAVYIFELDKKYDIDGNVLWNSARLINHSCSPNAEADVKKDHIWIKAIKKIKKGEEITYDYGYDLDEWQDHPCECKSDNCIGFIVSKEHWPKLIKKLDSYAN